MGATDRIPADRRETWIAVALVALAVLLRAWHVGWGLPDFTEEAIPLDLSFAMRSVATGALDLNPHAFSYPTLGIYLHLFVQQCVFWIGRLTGTWSNAADYQLAFYLDPSPMVLAARGVGIACDALAVLAAWRLGRRFSRPTGLAAALLVALSASMIVTARSVYVDSIMTCLSLWALERMLAWHASGGRGRLAAAAALVGLAAGAKYPAAVLMLPLALLALVGEGRRGVRSIAIAAGLAAVTFLVTTPYAVLDATAFLRDFSFEGHHAAAGHLGSEGHRSFAFHMGNLARDLGWPALIALVVSPIVAWPYRRRRVVTIALWLALLGFGVPISLARIDAGRYLLPVVATAGVLVAISASALLAFVPERARAVATGVVLAALSIVPLGSGWAAARRGARDTQVEARRWCESHIRRDQLVVSEGYGPRLADEARVGDLRSRPAYQYASPAWRRRVDEVPQFHVVALPLVVTGRLVNDVSVAGSAPVPVEIAPRASAIASVYYAPALYTGVDWFITTSAVRGRFTADSTHFGAACRLYRLLDQHAEVAARFVPRGDESGPEIVVYRIDERARSALGAGGPLDPLWWTAEIPEDYRRRVTQMLAAGAASPDAPPAPRANDGALAPWVQSLLPLYLKHVATFDYGLAQALALVGHFEDAARVAEANHMMMPQDVPTCLLASISLGRTERWSEARTTIERTLAVIDSVRPSASLRLQYARALRRTGEPERARALDRRLIAELPPGDPLAAAALADLSREP